MITNYIKKLTEKLFNVNNPCLTIIMARMDLDQLVGMTLKNVLIINSLGLFLF